MAKLHRLRQVSKKKNRRRIQGEQRRGSIEPLEFRRMLAAGPVIEDVFLRGAAWSEDFSNKLQLEGLGGGDGYSLSNPTVALPWNDVKEFVVRFSESVSITESDLSVQGTNSGIVDVSGMFSYDDVMHTATWKLPTALGVDKYALRVSDRVKSSAGNALDGEPSQFPSGDGEEGGDFFHRFEISPGDVTRDGITNVADGVALRGVSSPTLSIRTILCIMTSMDRDG